MHIYVWVCTHIWRCLWRPESGVIYFRNCYYMQLEPTSVGVETKPMSSATIAITFNYYYPIFVTYKYCWDTLECPQYYSRHLKHQCLWNIPVLYTFIPELILKYEHIQYISFEASCIDAWLYKKGNTRERLTAETINLEEERRKLKSKQRSNPQAATHYNYLCREVKWRAKKDRELYIQRSEKGHTPFMETDNLSMKLSVW